VQNILLGGAGDIVGVVDIGRVSFVHPTEELAQVTRWFGRRILDGRPVIDETLVHGVLRGYDEVVKADQLPLWRLPDLVWVCSASSPRLLFKIRATLLGENGVDPATIAGRLRASEDEADRLEGAIR
jgi:hypothetical protein